MSLNPFFRTPLSSLLNAGDWKIIDPFNEETFFPLRSKNEKVNLSPMMSADFVETPTEYKFHADLPGVEDVDLSIVNGMLIIKAERHYEHNVETDVLHSRERSFGRVERTFAIPDNVDVDKAEAKFKSGVLSISFPKITPQVTSNPVRKLAIKREDESTSCITPK